MKEKDKVKKEERETKAHRKSHSAQGGKRDDAEGSVSGQAVEDEWSEVCRGKRVKCE